jgi:membrane fusion protein YbhG
MSRRVRCGRWATGYWFLPFLLASGCSAGAAEYYEARGTVEVPEIDLAPVTAAKVVKVLVDEGAAVGAGDTLALLTQTDLPAALAGQQARVAEAQANLRDLEAGSRPQEIRKAEADLAAALAELDRATKALERARALVADNAIARQQYDDAVATNRVAEQRAAAAREALALARAGSRPGRIQAGRAEVSTARAALEQTQARATDLVLTAPVAGIVLGRFAEPGEALGPSVPVLTVGETGRPFVRVYLPQSLVSQLALGREVAVVTLDRRTIRGRIAAINPKAEFTPRVALTEQERADLMFGVKVEFVNPAEAPHPGLWVTVRVGKSGSREDGKTGGREVGKTR